jgi:steroid 5-alpha reductase family enzyme
VDGVPGSLNAVELILVGWLVTGLLMALLWLVQKAHQDAGIVDVGWCAGLGLVTILYALFSTGNPQRRLVVATMMGVWAFRLGTYLFLNRVLGKKEDGRYQTLRGKWGLRAQFYFFIFFQAQAFLVVIFSLPPLVALHNPQPTLSAWDYAGMLVWLTAITGELLADQQLARFRADPHNRGKTCRTGLWRYSRHPNYFFEWLHWWSYVLMAVGVSYGWITLIGPGLMLFFLFKVTGIPATEAQALASRGDDYRAYQRATSAFIPWLPREKDR